MVGQKPRLDPRRHRLIGSTAFDRWRGPLNTGDVYTSGFNPKRRTEDLTGKNGAESSSTGSRSGREADDGKKGIRISGPANQDRLSCYPGTASSVVKVCGQITHKQS